jgi:hypothetical protein
MLLFLGFWSIIRGQRVCIEAKAIGKEGKIDGREFATEAVRETCCSQRKISKSSKGKSELL